MPEELSHLQSGHFNLIIPPPDMYSIEVNNSKTTAGKQILWGPFLSSQTNHDQGSGEISNSNTVMSDDLVTYYRFGSGAFVQHPYRMG